MQKDDLIYIEHIRDCISRITEYTEGFSEEKFVKNSLISDAVIRNFEIIGEASKKISADFKALHTYIEWKKMAGMRDKLIHDYIGVDLWAVWGVVTDIVPEFKQQIDTILQSKA